MITPINCLKLMMFLRYYGFKFKLDLRGVDLRGVDLRWADLQGVNLQQADLQMANLQGVNLRGANMQEVDLQWVNLRGANLQQANMALANLQRANLQQADLRGANLQGTNMRLANIKEANIQEAILPYYEIVPQEGSFIAFKKVMVEPRRNLYMTGPQRVIKVLVPEDAKRVNAIGSRKIRVSKLKVIEGSGCSPIHSAQIVYKEGEIVDDTENFDDSITEVCAGGLHVFLTRREAELW